MEYLYDVFSLWEETSLISRFVRAPLYTCCLDHAVITLFTEL